MHPDLRSHLEEHRVVATATAREWCTPDELRAAVHRDELHRVWRGVLALPENAQDLRTRLAGLESASRERPSRRASDRPPSCWGSGSSPSRTCTSWSRPVEPSAAAPDW